MESCKCEGQKKKKRNYISVMAELDDETARLYAEYEAQLKEQEQLKKQQVSEGMQLVKKEVVRRGSQQNLLFNKSQKFVQEHEASEAERRMKMLMTSLIFCKRFVRNIRTRIKRRKEERAAADRKKIEESKRAEQEEKRAERERKENRAMKRAEELASIERRLSIQVEANEAKARQSLEDAQSAAALLVIESKENGTSESSKSPSQNGRGQKNKAKKKIPPPPPRKLTQKAKEQKVNANQSPKASGRSVKSTNSILPKQTQNKKVNWENAAVNMNKASQKKVVDEAEALSGMTSEGLHSLHETLQVSFRFIFVYTYLWNRCFFILQ